MMEVAAKIGGTILGVPLVGMLSDRLRPTYGDASLAAALEMAVLGSIALSLVAYAAAAPFVVEELATGMGGDHHMRRIATKDTANDAESDARPRTQPQVHAHLQPRHVTSAGTALH
jgi:hypothetical protein